MDETLQQREASDAGALDKKSFIKYYHERLSFLIVSMILKSVVRLISPDLHSNLSQRLAKSSIFLKSRRLDFKKASLEEAHVPEDRSLISSFPLFRAKIRPTSLNNKLRFGK